MILRLSKIAGENAAGIAGAVALGLFWPEIIRTICAAIVAAAKVIP